MSVDWTRMMHRNDSPLNSEVVNKFDELAKGMAQSVIRRQALKKFGVGLAGMAVTCFGLANRAHGGKSKFCLGSNLPCTHDGQCCSGVCQKSQGNRVGICL